MDLILLFLIIMLIIIIIYLIIIYKNDTFNNIYTKKIAFLFLIKDKINKEELWKNFFNNVDTDKYSIYIHYKDNIKLKYFEKYKLTNTIPTKWGDISLVHAQKILLKEAFKDEANYKFIFISDSCMPIKNFDYVYNFLIKNNNSYFNYENIKIKYNKTLYQTFQWCILNRNHTNIIINDTTEIEFYIKHNIFASDEIYFLTTIRDKLNNNIIINKTPDNYTTYVIWKDNILYIIKSNDFNNKYKKYKSDISFPNNGSPATYIKFDDNELKYLINDTKCLFLRKVTPNTILNEELLPY
jgi:hypothetical protein